MEQETKKTTQEQQRLSPEQEYPGAWFQQLIKMWRADGASDEHIRELLEAL